MDLGCKGDIVQSGVSTAVNIADLLFLNLPRRDGEGEDEDENKD